GPHPGDELLPSGGGGEALRLARRAVRAKAVAMQSRKLWIPACAGMTLITCRTHHQLRRCVLVSGPPGARNAFADVPLRLDAGFGRSFFPRDGAVGEAGLVALDL